MSPSRVLFDVTPLLLTDCSTLSRRGWMLICVATGSSELRHETIPTLLLLFSVHVLVRCLYLLYFTSKKCLPGFPLKLFLFGLEILTVTIDPNTVIQLSFIVRMLHTDPVNNFSSVTKFLFSICTFLFHKDSVLNRLIGRARDFLQCVHLQNKSTETVSKNVFGV